MPNRFNSGCKCCKGTCTLTVTVGNCFPADTSNHNQQISATGKPTAGTSQLSFAGQTASINWNAAVSDVQSALAGLSSIGSGNITCTGGPLPGTPIMCVLTGTLANTPQPLITHVDSLTGGALAITAVPGNVPPGATVELVSNAQQELSFTGKPASGGATFDFQGDTPSILPWNATPSQVLSALEALPSIGSGNLSLTGGAFPASTMLITFKGALAGAKQPLITADGSGLMGGTRPTAEVKAIATGGITLGPIDVPISGAVTFTGISTGEWVLTTTAPDYLDQTITFDFNCIGGPLPLFRAGLVPVDGKIITPGNPAPVQAPATCPLTGDPNGLSSLGLVSCTGGNAGYVCTKGPQAVILPCQPPWPPSCGNNGCAGPATFARQVWFTAFLGCQTGITVLFSFNPFSGGNFDGLFCVRAGAGSIEACNPQSGNPSCPFCLCADSWWNTGPGPGFNNVPVGTIAYPQLQSPFSVGLIGGGCFSNGQAPDPLNPNGPFIDSWVGGDVFDMLAYAFGTPQLNTVIFPNQLCPVYTLICDPVPDIKASIS